MESISLKVREKEREGQRKRDRKRAKRLLAVVASGTALFLKD